MNEKELIFAGVTRVSTEDQEKFGGSLKIQKEQIIASAKSLGADPSQFIVPN